MCKSQRLIPQQALTRNQHASPRQPREIRTFPHSEMRQIRLLHFEHVSIHVVDSHRQKRRVPTLIPRKLGLRGLLHVHMRKPRRSQVQPYDVEPMCLGHYLRLLREHGNP